MLKDQLSWTFACSANTIAYRVLLSYCTVVGKNHVAVVWLLLLLLLLLLFRSERVRKYHTSLALFARFMNQDNVYPTTRNRNDIIQRTAYSTIIDWKEHLSRNSPRKRAASTMPKVVLSLGAITSNVGFPRHQ
jgi:ABC-type anion transport system duplicated permease subunit